MTTAVEVPAERILAYLAKLHFAERVTRGTEIVYERKHHRDPRYRVLVYTSVRRGSASARGVGKDAIRVCAIFDDGQKTFGVSKHPRVHRTGTVEGVLGRMHERMRDAYGAINRRLNGGKS